MKKQVRFRRPEFQNKLAKARKFARKPQTSKPTRLFSKKHLIIFLLLVLTAGYFLTLSGVFLVREARISGEGISEESVNTVLRELEEERVFLVPKNHILLLSRESFTKELQARIPEVRKVKEYSRIFPNTVSAMIDERLPRYVWQTGDEYFLLDQDGVVFQEVPRYDPAVYPEILIHNTLSQPAVPGQDLNLKNTLKFIDTAQTSWGELALPVQIRSFALPGTDSRDLLVLTETGFEVIFDLNRPARAQLLNLELILSREIDPDTYSGLAYIDLRLADVAYYCYKDAPCAREGESGP